MGVDVAALKRLSTLLEEALDLDERRRESRFAALDGDDAPFAPKLRELEHALRRDEGTAHASASQEAEGARGNP
jgi:hypothetical protein